MSKCIATTTNKGGQTLYLVFTNTDADKPVFGASTDRASAIEFSDKESATRYISANVENNDLAGIHTNQFPQGYWQLTGVEDNGE